jgi:hypothetical protein
MSSPRKHPVLEPRLTTLDLYRLLDTYLRAGDEVLSRPWRLAAETLRRSSQHALGGVLGQRSLNELFSGCAQEYANLLCGLFAVVPTTIEGMSARLRQVPEDLLSPYHVPIGDSGPEAIGALWRLQGAEPRVPFVAPARVIDASQGWAAWFVPVEKLTAVMKSGVPGGATVLEAFEPLNCGHGRGLVVLLGVDYRVSDFGRYREIALAFCLTPKDSAAAAPGAYFARLIVSDAFSLEPAQSIWGFAKDHYEDLHVHYGRRRVWFHTAEGDEGDFLFALPRFGAARSNDVPLVIYALREAGDEDGLAGPVRAVLERSGSGEGVQIGGSVRLRLGVKPQASEAGSCFCGKADVACLCDQLRGLGIDKVLPAANGWSERMYGHLLPPGPLAPYPLGNN